ncbi:hypothetical protein HMPREF1573_00799 [Gardnerella vaginalis JCP7276]|nr:hypothetical protein HMPREF1573_00799 [Gardnerella vaginalis JCP7276]
MKALDFSSAFFLLRLKTAMIEECKKFPENVRKTVDFTYIFGK